MRRKFIGGMLAVMMTFSTVTTPQAKAVEPVTIFVVGALFSWVVGQTIDAGFQEVTGKTNIWDKNGKPNVNELKRQLDALADHDAKNATEIRALRDRVNNTMSRDEVKAELMKSLSKIDQQYAALAKRVSESEREIQSLKAENADFRQRLRDGETQTRRNTSDIQNIDQRVVANTREIEAAKERIKALERAASSWGVEGFSLMRKQKMSEAVEQFNTGISEDPTDAGYYYGKALALYHLNKIDDAKKAVKTGMKLELQRQPGLWFKNSLEVVQGPHRIWLEDTKQLFAPTAGSKP